MNKLYVLENLNNVIAREQNTSKSATRIRDFVLSRFYREGKYIGKKCADIYINFGNIYMIYTSYLNGRIQTECHIDIDVSDIVDIEYEGDIKLKLTRSNFLNVGREEIWKVGGIRKITDGSSINGIIVGGDDDNIWYQNKYDFKINGWKVPRDSFLTLRNLKGNPKKNILSFLVRYEVYMFLKFDEIFSLERC